MMLDNFAVIMDWIRFKKVRFLQDCNPGVPGIIYKLEVDEERTRKLGHARELWKCAVAARGSGIKSIYSQSELNMENIFDYSKVREEFEKCRRDNVNAIWAADTLYVEGNSRERFTSILEQNLRPVYEAARLQGYRCWIYREKDTDREIFSAIR